jgi:hypothetical protein
MRKTVNWGILSTGRISEKFAADLQFVPNARLAAVGSRDNDGQTESFEFSYKGMGYEYEAEEVTNCLQRDLKESALLPLDFSLRLIRVLDKMRKQCGIKYQADCD